MGLLNETSEEERNRDISVRVSTSQPFYPSLPSYAILYPTGSEIYHFYSPQTRGRNIDKFFFSIFIREQLEDLSKHLKSKFFMTNLLES